MLPLLCVKGEYSKEAVRRGMVTALDESVGRILEKLRETGHHDNTLVVFTSDNGAGKTLTTLQITSLVPRYSTMLTIQFWSLTIW